MTQNDLNDLSGHLPHCQVICLTVHRLPLFVRLISISSDSHVTLAVGTTQQSGYEPNSVKNRWEKPAQQSKQSLQRYIFKI